MNFDKCQLEANGDVISGVALEYVGMVVPAGFGDNGLDSCRIIRFFGWPDPFYALFAVFNCISAAEWKAATDVISGTFVWQIVPDKPEKFGDPCLNFLKKFHPKLSEVIFLTVFFAIASKRK